MSEQDLPHREIITDSEIEQFVRGLKKVPFKGRPPGYGDVPVPKKPRLPQKEFQIRIFQAGLEGSSQPRQPQSRMPDELEMRLFRGALSGKMSGNLASLKPKEKESPKDSVVSVRPIFQAVKFSGLLRRVLHGER